MQIGVVWSTRRVLIGNKGCEFTRVIGAICSPNNIVPCLFENFLIQNLITTIAAKESNQFLELGTTVQTITQRIHTVRNIEFRQFGTGRCHRAKRA